MKFKNLFKRKNTFQVGQFCKVWAYALSTEATVYAEVTGIDGDRVSVRYIDQEKAAWLLLTDSSFILPARIHFRDCRHVAYDEIKYCFELIKKCG